MQAPYLEAHISLSNGGAGGSGYSFFLRPLRGQMSPFVINKLSIYEFVMGIILRSV